MRILIVHNYYQQPGGEDVVFEAESQALIRYGHNVVTYTASNSRAVGLGSVALGARMIWSGSSQRDLTQMIRKNKPDIAHFHNIFWLISPSAYYVCQEYGVRVVQSLHNPRLLCPAASFFRDGRACEECLEKVVAWPGIVHGCYRGARLQTAAIAGMLAIHRLAGTWDKQVDAYIVFTEFYRKKFIQGGLPAERIFVKPHFVEPDPGETVLERGDYGLFIGRLDVEKGVLTLLRAWTQLKSIPLKIRGDGRLRGEVERTIQNARMRNVELVGRLSADEMRTLVKQARFLVWPSEGYYETFGLVAIEAFACGVPVIASGAGAMAEIVVNGKTGLHFLTGSAESLADKVSWAWNHPEEMRRMGRNARKEYELKYTFKRNHAKLLEIYQAVVAGRARSESVVALQASSGA